MFKLPPTNNSAKEEPPIIALKIKGNNKEKYYPLIQANFHINISIIYRNIRLCVVNIMFYSDVDSLTPTK